MVRQLLPHIILKTDKGHKMKNNNKNSDNISVFLESLESKKSERTTLKLTEKAIEGLSYLQTLHCVSVKELIDLMYALIDAEDGFDIEEIIKNLKERPRQICKLPRKTYVLSKGSIMAFSALSKKIEVSRDDLISYMIEEWVGKCKALDEELKEKYREGYKILAEYEAYTKDVHLKFDKIIGLNFALVSKDLTPDIDILCNSTACQIAKLKEKLEKLISEEI